MNHAKISLAFGLLLLCFNKYLAAEITNIKVPSFHALNHHDNKLILDCDFKVANGKGAVFKWFYNSQVIYQWIPSMKRVFVLGGFKGRVDVNHASSGMNLTALIIAKPLISDSGNFTCQIQTFQGSDKKSAMMQVIHPESSIDLSYVNITDKETDELICKVNNIYPIPQVKFSFGKVPVGFTLKTIVKNVRNTEGFYDVKVIALIKKIDIQKISHVECVVKIPNTDYIKESKIVDIRIPSIRDQAEIQT